MDSETSIPAGDDRTADDEVALLRQRLAWFESFDELMQSSVGNAGDILREAIEMREAATRDRHEAIAVSSRQHSETLLTYRAVFSGMLDDVTQLQGDAERIARRLSDAIDALEAELQPAVAFPSLPTSLNAQIASTVESPDSALDAFDDMEALATEELGPISDQMSPLDVLPAHSSITPAPEPPPAATTAAEDKPFILLMHGVSKAATALSLKSYLERLDFVERVEPREFAAGVLRLQIQTDRALVDRDLASWEPGRDVTTLHARPGLLEVKLN